MILNRVLPPIHYSVLDAPSDRQLGLADEVVTMLKASICYLGIGINTNDDNIKNLNLNRDDVRRNYYQSLHFSSCLCTWGYEWDSIEGSLNIVVDQLNKDTRENSSYTAQLNLWNSDDCSQKDLKNNLLRQHGKSDLFHEKDFSAKLNHPYLQNNSLIFTSSVDRDQSSSLKQLKEGFKVLTPTEKATIFDNKRDDLYYKTFGRDVRKFLQDDFTEFTGYSKDSKGKEGRYFYSCLVRYAEHMNFHKNTDVTLGNIVWYLGSLINHREFKKSCPTEFLDLSYQVYNTFNLFTKERLFNLWWSQEFKLLFRYYVAEVGQENRFSRLRNHKTIGSNLAPYLFVYNEFCRVCLI